MSCQGVSQDTGSSSSLGFMSFSLVIFRMPLNGALFVRFVQWLAL